MADDDDKAKVERPEPPLSAQVLVACGLKLVWAPRRKLWMYTDPQGQAAHVPDLLTETGLTLHILQTLHDPYLIQYKRGKFTVVVSAGKGSSTSLNEAICKAIISAAVSKVREMITTLPSAKTPNPSTG